MVKRASQDDGLADTFEDIKNKAQIVRQIDLKAILKQTGATHDTFDKAKWHTSQGAISITGQKFMNWHQGVGGGGAIDLIIHLKAYDFKTAVSWLSETFPPCTALISNNPKPDKKCALRLPTRDDRKLAQIANYLSYDRFVPAELINSMINSGKLYADKKANAVFLLLGKQKTVSIDQPISIRNKRVNRTISDFVVRLFLTGGCSVGVLRARSGGFE